MKVFVLVYDAEFDNEEYHNVYAYDSYEKAHNAFVDIAKDWFNEDMFNTEMPTKECNWNDEKYYGFYGIFNSIGNETLYIEETDNVVNHLSLRVEELNVM